MIRTRLPSLAFASCAVVLAALFAAQLGCSASARPRHGPTAKDYPWQLRKPADFGADFLWRQQLQARFGLRKLGFQAVLQKRGDALTLLGLGPAGSKAFVLKQTGTEVSFRSYMPRPLPFPPRFILTDIQRAYVQLSDATPPRDGDRELALPGERLVETWRGGRLVRRRYSRINGKPKGWIEITYGAPTASGGDGGGGGLGLVVLKNGWFGYELRIETLSAQQL